MIIDLILDRYHGDAYDPKKFYDAVMDYEEGTEYPISRALDGGEEEDVKRALCDYIDGEYNPNIKKFINAVEWLMGDDGKDYSKEIDIMAESKNESDFGAFDWTVTVSYIDKETGDKVSDVFLIKAHNMPSAKEQAILRANRKGTDAKVDSCRMGDYVSNESKTSEASPRKWRADPADRGVGGKWGPADTYNINRDDREQSAKNWKDQGTLDSEFIGLLKSELNKSGNPFKVNDENKDSASVGFIAKASDFGINDIDMSMVGRDMVDCDDSNLPRNGIARLLNKICKDVLEDDRKGGAGVGVTFGSSNEASYDTVWLDIFYPSIDDPDLTLGAYPTRKEIVTYSIDVAKKVTDYLKKMASTINKEASRKFGKQESKSMNKCSMQKKIESLSKKNESVVGRDFFDTFISERAHDILEEYNVNEACGGMCDAWYEIGDGVEAVERDDRSGYFSYNDGGWKKAWMTTPFNLAGQGYLDYRSEPEYDRLQDMCEDDYKEHCEKEGIECDLRSDDFYDFENQWWSEGCEIFAYAEIFLYSRDSSEGRYILYGRVSRSFDYTYGRNPKDDLEVSMEFTSSDQLTEENANKFLDAVKTAFAEYSFKDGYKEISVDPA